MTSFRESHAAIVGIDAYEGGIATLKSAVADARAVADTLGGEHGYRVERRLDATASLAALLELFEGELPRRVGEGDRLFVYFAGHGIARDGRSQKRGTGGPEGYLLPSDARPADPSTWLGMDRLREALDALPCRHLLVVLDCCFAGSFRWAATRSFVPVAALTDSQYERFLTATAWQALTSAAHHEKAFDVLPGQSDLRDGHSAVAPSSDRPAVVSHSPFAAALLAGLAGAADSARGGFETDGIITATELSQYIHEELVQAGAVQTPGLWPLKPDSTGEYVFIHPGTPRQTRPDPPLDDGANPWRGLHAYRRADASLFFGRERVLEALLERFTGPTTPRLVAVLGASGVGKSSLVRAGLLPRLVRDGWRVAVAEHFAEDPDRRLDAALEDLGASGRRLLVLDQLEELVTQGPAPARQEAVLARLARRLAADGELRVVVTLRADFEPRFAAVPGFGSLLDSSLDTGLGAGRFLVPAPDRGELRQVIERPARHRALFFEPRSLVEELVDEVVAMPAPLPMLSYVLSEAYRRALLRRRWDGVADRAITAADVASTGGVVGALHRRASELTDAADPARRATVRRIFLRLISIEGGLPSSRRVSRRELLVDDPAEAARVESVLADFTAARLLVRDREHVAPAHDTLVLAWRELAEWRSEAAAELPLLRAAWRAAVDWQAADADPRRLWHDDPRLPQLLACAADLNRLEARFARESEARRRRRRRVLAGGATALGGALAFLAVRASSKARLAEERLRDAVDVADEIVRTADRELQPIPGTAAVRARLLDASSRLLDRLRRGARKDLETLRSRVWSHLRRGDLARSHGHLERVEEEYRAAYALAERLVAGAPVDDEARHALARSSMRLAGVARDRDHRVRAAELYTSARDILIRLAPASPVRRDLAIVEAELGGIARLRGELDAARDLLERSLVLRRDLVAEQEAGTEQEAGAKAQQDLYIGLDLSGDLHLARGDLETAGEILTESLAIKRRLLASEPRHPQWQRALAFSHERLGDLAEARGDLETARSLSEKSHAIRLRLAETDPDNRYWRRDLEESRGRLDRLGLLPPNDRSAD